MPSNITRKVLTGVATAALLVGLVGTMTGSSSAANLTGGSYTYVVNGEEVSFPFDPILRKDGTLVPLEVFQQFGVNVDGALTRNITLTKASVTAKLVLGTTTITLNGQPGAVSTAPMRLNGRLFIPGDLLKEFGVDFSQDSNFVIMRNLVEGQPTIKQLSDSDFQALKIGRNFTMSVKADSSIYMNGEMTLLTPDILSAQNLNLSYGTRSRLQSMIQTNTLILVKLSNSSFKSGAMVTPGTYLVDDQRSEYDLLSVLDLGQGLLSNKLAPAADRLGVLVFPKLSTNTSNVVVYYDNNGSSLGTFTNVK